MHAPPEIWATAEQGPVSPQKSAKSAKALYERVGPGICSTQRQMLQSPVKSARMCRMMMSSNMYKMMYEVAKYIGIEIDTHADVVDVFTMTLMYCGHMLVNERNKKIVKHSQKDM